MVNTSRKKECDKVNEDLDMIKMVAIEKLHDFFLYKIIRNYCSLHKQMHSEFSQGSKRDIFLQVLTKIYEMFCNLVSCFVAYRM